MMEFSDTVNNDGGLQQVRKLMRVDANQWPTINVVNSFNHWLDFITGYAIGVDKRFQWDNTQHTKLPEGTAELTQDVSDYSFQADEQGNQIITLLGISVLKNGKYEPLIQVDRNNPDYDTASFGQETGTPTKYDKIADNIARLDKKPPATVSAGIKFYFQRTSPRYAASDTTKTSGFSALLDRGFVIAGAYDGALTLGLPNLQGLLIEREKEEQKVIQYFADRNQDTKRRMSVGYHSMK